MRNQYHHSTDIVPTILDACGVELPESYNGVEQTPLSGVSMRYTFDAADAPTAKETQYYEMLGTRGIWHEGWKAVAEHGPMAGHRQLRRRPAGSCSTPTRTAPRRTTSPTEHPEKVEELKALWMEEAEANNVLPLNDLQIIGNPKDFETFIAMEFHVPVPPSGQYTYYPGTSEVPERSAANVHGVSYKVLAEVELTPDTEGVIFAHGSRFGGHALFIKDGKLTYVYNFLGIPPENRISAPAPTSGTHIVGVEFTKERMGEHREGIGPLKLYIDDQLVGRGRRSARCMGHFSLCGEGLCIGYDSGDAVSSACTPSRLRVHRRRDRQGRLRRRRRRLHRRRGAPRGGHGARLTSEEGAGCRGIQPFPRARSPRPVSGRMPRRGPRRRSRARGRRSSDPRTTPS